MMQVALVKQKIGENNLVFIENSATYSEQQQDLINSLRILIPQAMVTTFVHEPLIGVKSITDPSGRVIHYEFDNAHRLNIIYDEERNIIKAYDYYYKK
ncbi:RHS repeat domain-containing protein [Anaerorhabdus sp.]|uniref:RHS repeat domain-containing protein n=1 Tax=Anaerorhabdus sp. TaxID=1872524 RepID=UPI002FCAD075